MAALVPQGLANRRAYSEGRLTELRDVVATKSQKLIDVGLDLTKICIYTTGSYGRGEASPTSDVDLFIVDEGGEEENSSLSQLEQLRLKTALIEVCEDELKLPPFDGDGRFLTIHLFPEMIGALGGIRDDVLNYFTARLLLLLESRPIYNEDVYAKVIEDFLGEYYKDFLQHEEDFLPAYLINDIVRYWKTLCLNYEHARRTDLAGSDQAEEVVRLKYKLKNLKLAFNRIMTCFSALTGLAYTARKGVVPLNDVVEMVNASPTERLEALGEDSELHPLVTTVLEEYAWFLSTLATDKREAIDWLSVKDNRDEAHNHATTYRDAFHDLLLKAGGDGQLVTFVTM